MQQRDVKTGSGKRRLRLVATMAALVAVTAVAAGGTAGGAGVAYKYGGVGGGKIDHTANWSG